MVVTALITVPNTTPPSPLGDFRVRKPPRSLVIVFFSSFLHTVPTSVNKPPFTALHKENNQLGRLATRAFNIRIFTNGTQGPLAKHMRLLLLPYLGHIEYITTITTFLRSSTSVDISFAFTNTQSSCLTPSHHRCLGIFQSDFSRILTSSHRAALHDFYDSDFSV